MRFMDALQLAPAGQAPFNPFVTATVAKQASRLKPFGDG